MGKPKTYHQHDLKNTLISAGLAILAEDGISELNLRAVARRAEVSHTAPYRHFADKEALIVAIAEDGFRRLGEKLEAARSRTSGDAQARLMAVGYAYIAFAVEEADSFRLMFSHVIQHRTQYLELCALVKACFQILQSLIEAGQASGEFASGNSVDLAKSAWAMIHGLASLLIEGQFSEDAQDAQMQAQTIHVHLGCVLTAFSLTRAT
jgi:AcrR family transcriptional regulator